jgi:hypothetical protein
MSKITKQFANTNNGGQERVTRDGDNYYINSYPCASLGWLGERKVTRAQLEACMNHVNAPADVVAAILG